MKDIIERIKLLSDTKSRSIREFSSIIGIPQTTLNNQLIGKRGLSLETILAIVNSFEDVSVDWLLRGKGEMILQEISPNSLIEDLKAEINQLKGENKIMREMLNLNIKSSSERTKTA
ncbi:helix-turn-helix domain-containing protein [Phocaeicola plebeius]|uniref:Helix-turn-helix domain-containing protein n=1 Tax=Phocaeicola plebeius TaxID=310297 RepID=A0A921HLV5_9BACT|nr:helix-turn-helix transcriptional regulator [Phocaeicola plebeius]HJF82332.1 helix-turn-helix domain-containing protein [Phocaeicola plebeius]